MRPPITSSPFLVTHISCCCTFVNGLYQIGYSFLCWLSFSRNPGFLLHVGWWHTPLTAVLDRVGASPEEGDYPDPGTERPVVLRRRATERGRVCQHFLCIPALLLLSLWVDPSLFCAVSILCIFLKVHRLCMQMCADRILNRLSGLCFGGADQKP